MKYCILLISLLFSLTSYSLEPKYLKGQCVKFTIPRFYSQVCSPYAMITSYTLVSNSKEIYIEYRLFTANKKGYRGCDNQTVKERDIISLEDDSKCN